MLEHMCGVSSWFGSSPAVMTETMKVTCLGQYSQVYFEIKKTVDYERLSISAINHVTWS